MTTSQKHKDFVAEPMGEKEVMALAGIGDVLGKRLQDKGFDKVIFFFVTRYIITTDKFLALLPCHQSLKMHYKKYFDFSTIAVLSAKLPYVFL